MVLLRIGVAHIVLSCVSRVVHDCRGVDTELRCNEGDRGGLHVTVNERSDPFPSSVSLREKFETTSRVK